MLHPEKRRENRRKLEVPEWKTVCIYCLKPFLSFSSSADVCQECLKEQFKAALEIGEAEGGW